MNVCLVLRKIRRDAELWGTLPLSASGKTALAKMMPLPRLLYLFTTLLVHIGRPIFKELDIVHIVLVLEKEERD